jgi:hypothetical protein
MSYDTTYSTTPCVDCGGPALVGRRAKNTKYCSTCRLYRGVQSGKRTYESTCIGCDKPHTRWMGSGEKLCGTCFMVLHPHGGRESVEGTCRVCMQPSWVYTKDVEVCYPCLYNPTNRKVLAEAILRKQVQRLTQLRIAGTIQTDPNPTKEAV